MVSILVLMEAVLQLLLQSGHSNVIYSFNPCFNGSCSAIEVEKGNIEYSQEGVSILVLMEAVLQSRTAPGMAAV